MKLKISEGFEIAKNKKAKALPLEAIKALGGRGGIAPIHS
jgi:hypothetical protein